MLDLCLLGTGGMMPLPYRWLTSLVCRCNGSSLLIDCGEGTQIAMRKRGWTPKPVDVILFTHYHADHISGLPGFLLSMANSDRTEPLTMIGPRGLERVVSALRVITPELPFKIKYIELNEQREHFSIGPYEIDAFRVNHNVVCYGYSIRILRKGRFDAERAKALDIPLKFWNPLQKGQTMTEGDRTYTPDMVMGPDRKGIHITYCTDTRPVPVIAEFAEGADLFICEGMYGEKEKAQSAREKKHMTMQEAANLAKTARPAEMWLTHYSPSLIHPEEFADEIKEIFPQAKTARDGWTKTIDFEEEETEDHEKTQC